MNENLNQELPKFKNSVNAPRESFSKINASALSSRVADLCGCSLLQSKQGLELTTNAIVDLTVASGHLMLNGIGTFEVRQRGCSADKSGLANNVDNKILRATVKFIPSQILKSIINEPLSERSIALANFDPTESIHSFKRVSSIIRSEFAILEKVITEDRGTTEDLFNLMHCRGMPSKQVAHNFFHSVRAVIRTALMKNESVTISGFGSFAIKAVPTRQAINPRTLEPITVPAHRKVSFKPGTDFKDRISKYNQRPS
jgi:DNA-binding protein HU-beta